MPAAPLPADEAARLAELQSYEILDTAPDPRFDTFVRLAINLYDVPIALVSLVDGRRQWLKAAIGVGDVSETPREHSFCARAILEPDEVMVVEDASLDVRFLDNPLVTGGPNIRFYAGAPIVGSGGHALGTLCIIDCKPRQLSGEDRRILADLAAGVSSVLELHHRIAGMKRAATHDPLTGLANRSLFEPELESAVAATLTGSTCAVLCLDLDHFKAVNDTYGHAGGDIFLCEVAKRLRGIIRPTDLAGRLGGDEFVILMRGPFPPQAPQMLAERILVALEAPVLIDGDAVPIRCSMGYAAAPPRRDGPSLMRAADMALYAAKEAGRGTIVAAIETSMVPQNLALVEMRSIERDLRRALDTGAFTLHWQPYFCAGSGAIEGFEALIRWDRPGHGPVSPAVFIPAAEAAGLIVEIDRWVLEAACTVAANWPAPYEIAVNISADWLCMRDMASAVAVILHRTAFAPGRLILELTERVVVTSPLQVQQRIRELHDLGARLALDDFGMGYSSLACLRDFAFDRIKLDISFIRSVAIDPKARGMVCAILALGRVLEMPVCAEGVETEFQLDFLKAKGCELVQGYLLGRPSHLPMFEPDPRRPIHVWHHDRPGVLHS